MLALPTVAATTIRLTEHHTIDIDFNHITLSRVSLMLYRFSFEFFPSIFGRPMFTLSARCTTIFALRLTLFHFFFRFSHFEFAHRFICLELPMTSKCLFEIGKNKNSAARCRSNQRGRFSRRFFFLLYCLL